MDYRIKMVSSRQEGLVVSLLAFNIVAQILDGTLTFMGVSRGLAGEGNPLLAFAIANLGLGFSLFLAKACGMLFVALLARVALSRPPRTRLYSIGALVFCGAVMAATCLAWVQILFA